MTKFVEILQILKNKFLSVYNKNSIATAQNLKIFIFYIRMRINDQLYFYSEDGDCAITHIETLATYSNILMESKQIEIENYKDIVFEEL